MLDHKMASLDMYHKMDLVHDLLLYFFHMVASYFLMFQYLIDKVIMFITLYMETLDS